jgi:hypothetical protein
VIIVTGKAKFVPKYEKNKFSLGGSFTLGLDRIDMNKLPQLFSRPPTIEDMKAKIYGKVQAKCDGKELVQVFKLTEFMIKDVLDQIGGGKRAKVDLLKCL